MKPTILLLALLLAGVGPGRTTAAGRPRLVVNLVVGSMRAGDLDRYSGNFCEGGFRRLIDGGTRYTDSHYDYQRTTTPVSLATLTTGAMPSTHGVVGLRWRDYADNSVEELIVDRKVTGLTRADETYSPCNLIAPTLGDALQGESSESRIVTVAIDPVSAVVMGGRSGEAYWLEQGRNEWTSSSYYMASLPAPVQHINRHKFNSTYIHNPWSTLLYRDQHVNTRNSDVRVTDFKSNTPGPRLASRCRLQTDNDKLRLTPAGNTALIELAKQLVTERQLGVDEAPDLLNICFDTARFMSETFGPESMEVEDMFYRLDHDIEDFLTFLFSHTKNGEVVVVLTSDHGTSPSYDIGEQVRDRFNTRQAEVIVNSFLGARYGTGEWVLACEEGAFYLNHNLIYAKGKSLAEIQNEVATFVMQLRGVSHAQSASDLRSSSFGSGYARRMQNSFYPRRSGDVIIDLMPGWIEEREGCISTSGSMYGYDTHVPLLFYGSGIAKQRIHRRVEMTQVAPTLARLLAVETPAAAEGAVLTEITEN